MKFWGCAGRGWHCNEVAPYALQSHSGGWVAGPLKVTLNRGKHTRCGVRWAGSHQFAALSMWGVIRTRPQKPNSPGLSQKGWVLALSTGTSSRIQLIKTLTVFSSESFCINSIFSHLFSPVGPQRFMFSKKESPSPDHSQDDLLPPLWRSLTNFQWCSGGILL